MTGRQDLYRTYAEFWPYYLRQHSKRATRFFHIAGTLLALLLTLEAIISFKIGWLLLAPLFGYGCAWFAHKHIEENHPATFAHPLWSLRADLQMLWLWLIGRLKAELTKHEIKT